MARRFFWAIFGVAAGVIVVFVIAAVALVNLGRVSATRSEMRRAGSVVADVMGQALSSDESVTDLLQGRLGQALSGRLDDIRRAAGGNSLEIIGITPRGVIIGRGGAQQLPLDIGELRRGTPQFLSTRQGGVSRQILAQPVGSYGPRDAEVVVLLARAVPVQSVRPWVILVPMALVALAAAVVAVLLAGGLERRLRPVVEAAGALSAGDLEARVEAKGEDELATLGHAFNDMADRLQATRRREQEFLLSVGHDLRTPLTTIAGYAEALEDGIEDPGELHRIATVLAAQTTRLRRMIEDLMLLARLEASEFGLRPEPVDVAAHLSEVVQAFRRRAATARISVVEDLEPSGRRSVDPDRVAQIADNILENALRYTPEAGTVTVRLRAEPRHVALEVGDTGPGIDSGDLPHVFDRFYVARHYREARPEGSGLGLSIVKTLAEAMGGDASAETTPGSGTTVRVRLPAPPV